MSYLSAQAVAEAAAAAAAANEFQLLILETLQPITDAFVMRVGRPRHERITETRNKAFDLLGGYYKVTSLVWNPVVWRHAVGQVLPCSRAA